MKPKPEPLRVAHVYDKHRPEGQQQVASLEAFTDKSGAGFVAFVCQQTTDGLSVLSKQHAVEFASVLLMLALGLPGDIPAGDCGVDPSQTKAPPES